MKIVFVDLPVDDVSVGFHAFLQKITIVQLKRIVLKNDECVEDFLKQRFVIMKHIFSLVVC